MSESGLSTNAKIASILFLLFNYTLTVGATPLGTAEMSVSRFYWLLLLAILAILSLIYFLTKTKSPVEVLGLAYDKTKHKLELTVRNGGDERYCIKSALRLIQPVEDVMREATADGSIPMATAKVSLGNRRLFNLLCEDDSPIVLEPNETRTLVYDLLVPAEYLKLDSTKNVEVHINYGEDEGEAMSQAISDRENADGICLKLDSGEVVAEAFLLEDLLDALKKSPDELVNMHMSNGNDFAQWVRNVVADEELALRLSSVEHTNPSEAKCMIIKVLEEKVESLKHPYLRRVRDEHKFYLKADHGTVLSEITVLEELAERLAASPASAVSFHTRDGNDFARWVEDVVGDTQLASRLKGLDYSNPQEAKDKAISAIRERVDSLK